MYSEQAPKFEPIVFSKAAGTSTLRNLSSGRRRLLKWLGTVVRVELYNGLVLVGTLECTDREGNLVLSSCATYQDEKAEPMWFGSVMVPGGKIKKFSVDVPEQQRIVDQLLDTMIDDILQQAV